MVEQLTEPYTLHGLTIPTWEKWISLPFQITTLGSFRYGSGLFHVMAPKALKLWKNEKGGLITVIQLQK